MANRSDVITGALIAAGAGAVLIARAAMQKARDYDFRGKVVLITGGSRGLGLVLAREFAAEGAQLALCARDLDDLKEAQRDLETLGAGVFVIPCDLRDLRQTEEMVRTIIDHYGRVDVLVNNAGTIAVGPMETMTPEDYHEQMDSNFWSAVHATLAVLPDMKRRMQGRIVNISSIGGKIAIPHLILYSASKFALTGFSRGMRAELGKDGVLVTTVCPGLMRTGSPRNADFKGQNQAEYAWFSVADSTPGVSMAAERAARQIIDACRKGEVEVILSLQAKVAATVDQLFPEISGGVISMVARLLPGPGGVGTERKKGYESESAIAPSPLTALGERAALRNNER